MGQAFDKDGNVLGAAEGESIRAVLDTLERHHPDASEFRIRTMAEQSASALQQKAAGSGYSERLGPSQKPSIGRIVIYNHPGSADGKYPPTQSPAIIQHVGADGSVRLFVFGPKGQHMDDGLTQGDGPCQWNWPPRV